jgi:hypothetical protein
MLEREVGVGSRSLDANRDPRSFANRDRRDEPCDDPLMEVRVRWSLAFALALACGGDEDDNASEGGVSAEAAAPVGATAEQASAADESVIEDDEDDADARIEGTVEPGQTFGQILNDHELKGPEIRLVVRAMREHFEPDRLKVGQEYALTKRGGALVGVEFAIRRGRRVRAEKQDGTWTAELLEPPE